MAFETGIVIDIDSRRARAGADQVRRELTGIGDTADRQIGQRTQGAFERLRGSVFSLRGAIAGLGIGLAVRQFVSLADEARTIENRLNLVTDSAAELTRVQQSLFEIAQRTNQVFSSTADLYVRLAQAGGELGKTEQELLRFTEAVGQGIAISGANAQSASGALLQLGQAIGAGVVRAEEFNSILEGTPRIAQAVADGLDEAGGSVGRLRRLIAEGEVSSREFFDALLSQADQLDSEFGKMDQTVGQALTGLQNSFTNLVGHIDSASGATSTLVVGINALTSAIDTLVALDDEVSTFFDVFGEFDGGALQRALEGTIPTVGTLERGLIALGATAEGLDEVLGGPFERLGEIISREFNDIDLVERFRAELDARAAANGEMDAYSKLLAENTTRVEENTEANEKLANERERVARALAGAQEDLAEENAILEAQVAGRGDLVRELEIEAEVRRLVNSIQTDNVRLSADEVANIESLVRAQRELNDELERQAEARRKAAEAQRKAQREAEEERRKAEREEERRRSEEERRREEEQRRQEEVAREIGAAFGDTFKSIIKGTEDVGDAFEKLADRIFDILLELATQQILKSIGLGGGGSDFSGLFGLGATLLGGLGGFGGTAPFTSANPFQFPTGAPNSLPHLNPFHAGGVVGRDGGPARPVSVMALATAPRFHEGGFVGLGPNEVPAILERGERVLSREQAANTGNVVVNVTFPNARNTAEARQAGSEIAAKAAAAAQRGMVRKGFG